MVGLFAEVPPLQRHRLIFLILLILIRVTLDERVLTGQQVTLEARELLEMLEFRQPLLGKHLWVEREVTVEPEVMVEREVTEVEGVEFLYAMALSRSQHPK